MPRSTTTPAKYVLNAIAGVITCPLGLLLYLTFPHCLPSYGNSFNGMAHQLAGTRVCVDGCSCQPVPDYFQKGVVSSAGGLGAWYQYPVGCKGDREVKQFVTFWSYPLYTKSEMIKQITRIPAVINNFCIIENRKTSKMSAYPHQEKLR